MSVVNEWLLQFEREEELQDMHHSLLFIPTYYLENDEEEC